MHQKFKQPTCHEPQPRAPLPAPRFPRPASQTPTQTKCRHIYLHFSICLVPWPRCSSWSRPVTLTWASRFELLVIYKFDFFFCIFSAAPWNSALFVRLRLCPLQLLRVAFWLAELLFFLASAGAKGRGQDVYV